jgi:hypothetical protein
MGFLVPRLLDRGRDERGGVQRASASLPDLRPVSGKGLHCGKLHYSFQKLLLEYSLHNKMDALLDYLTDIERHNLIKLRILN